MNIRRFAKLAIVLMLLCFLPIAGSCNDGSEAHDTTEANGEETMHVNSDDNYEGTLRFDESTDGKSVTISYTLNGPERICRQTVR